METAKAWGLTPSGWRMQSVDDRARMITHELIKGIREAYIMEKSRNKDDSKDNDYEKLKKAFGAPKAGRLSP